MANNFLSTEVTLSNNSETDIKLRNKIYKEYIDYPFNKLVENIYHTFKFMNLFI